MYSIYLHASCEFNFLAGINMACCTHWVRETSIVLFVVCSLQSGYTTTREKHIYFNNSQLNWWEARANCQANEGDLFVPVTEPEPSRMPGTRNRYTYYWLGAMRYSTWTWTDDGNPLYINSGLSTLPADLENVRTFPDNSVNRCHRYCGSDTHTLGLSRDRCFCLRDDYKASGNTSGEPCPGNPDEVCGYADRLSVYKCPFEDSTDFVFTPTGNGQCGYAIKNNGKFTISLDDGDSCKTTDRRYACYAKGITRGSDYTCKNGVCASTYRRKRTWTEANDTYDLVKLESSIVKDLQKTMHDDSEYWIGLVYRPTMKWITEQEASEYDEYSSSEPQCLVVYFTIWYQQLSWKPCSFLYASICEVVVPKTSTTTMTPQHSSSPAAATTASETPTYQPPGNVPTSESYMSTSTNNPEVGPTEPVTASNGTQTGVFIGLGCVVLMLVGIIVVLLLMRQNKLCFKRKDKEQSMHFNTATQNTTYDVEVPTQSNTSAYTDITLADMTDVKPMSSAVPMATVRPRVQNYDNTFPSDGDENDYNVLSPPGKHHAPVTAGNPIHNLPGPVRGDYDTAQACGQGTGSTGLNNSGSSAARRSPKAPQGDDDVVGQHDPGGAAEVYDHLRDGEGGHATPQQGKTPKQVDDSYSHIGRTNKGFDDNAYDVASARQTEDRRDDTYNHTDSVDDNPGDTNDYYNTRSLFRDNNESLGRQDDIPDNTDVYSVAKRISDA
ncbi:uncharacterized protein LOC124285960 isoform X2 [Haliotis rubra]|uniref:uncharacterized protein LOC124285960 isoform X2 n=1 Tax=Haliotis rubra TaxID=36100 RepID=UPI001EE53E12|nr:uncharacterized protein LOC124285960 isoform X2 [Haliotis rubra]